MSRGGQRQRRMEEAQRSISKSSSWTAPIAAVGRLTTEASAATVAGRDLRAAPTASADIGGGIGTCLADAGGGIGTRLAAPDAGPSRVAGPQGQHNALLKLRALS